MWPGASHWTLVCLSPLSLLWETAKGERWGLPFICWPKIQWEKNHLSLWPFFSLQLHFKISIYVSEEDWHLTFCLWLFRSDNIYEIKLSFVFWMRSIDGCCRHAIQISGRILVSYTRQASPNSDIFIFKCNLFCREHIFFFLWKKKLWR